MNDELKAQGFTSSFIVPTSSFLVARQGAGGEPTLYKVTTNTPEKRLGVPIVVTRAKPEANSARLKVGDRVAVGLTAFRVLPNFTLASERGGRIVDTRK